MSISNPVIAKVTKHFGYVMVDLLKTAEGILNAETELEDEAKVNAEKKAQKLKEMREKVVPSRVSRSSGIVREKPKKPSLRSKGKLLQLM
ncbi:MAG TPA: hypothetical protein EYQ47_05670 [Cycloclasticus sp.]|nr:hypothetical protein [Cycloclasticus sp.]